MDKKTGESKLQKAGKRTLILNSSESGFSNLVKYCQFMILTLPKYFMSHKTGDSLKFDNVPVFED